MGQVESIGIASTRENSETKPVSNSGYIFVVGFQALKDGERIVDCRGLLWKNRIAVPKQHRNFTGGPGESINLDPWGSQSLKHQQKKILLLDIILPELMLQMCSLVFLYAS